MQRTHHALHGRLPLDEKKNLTDTLLAAIENDRAEEAKRVRDMLRNKAQKKEWGRIKQTMDTGGYGLVTEVNKPIECEEAIHHDTEETVVEALGDEISKRCERANSEPICQGALFNLLGDGANTETAEKILDGTFGPPEGTDGPTVILLEI